MISKLLTGQFCLKQKLFTTSFALIEKERMYPFIRLDLCDYEQQCLRHYNKLASLSIKL